MNVSPTERVVAVAFCSDRFMEAPLHVAMASLLRSLADGYHARFYLILPGFDMAHIDLLRRTLDRTRRFYSLHILAVEPEKVFSGFPTLHGSLVPYYRLLLPDLVNERLLLYLDSDLLVNIDVAPLFDIDLESKPIGAILNGNVEYSLDQKFQLSIGRRPEDRAFNSGVLLFSLIEWHRQGCTERVLAFGRKHGSTLISHDQSILNALFAEDCCGLDPRFNIHVYASTDVRNLPARGIFHFVGSPKPWDILGEFLHPYAKIWNDASKQTVLSFMQRNAYFDLRSWRRLPRIIGGYRRILRQRNDLIRERRRK